MKVRRNLLIAFSLLSLSVNAQRIKGSDTVLPVAQQTAERFMNQHPDARVTVTGGGTGVGISALMDNTTDIAMASRPIKFSEKMKIKEAGQDVDEIIVAYDALAVVVHPSNPVKQLTRQQLEDIFRGKITNWKQVGGDDRKIVVYSRETSSGTYEFFKESVLKNKNYMSEVFDYILECLQKLLPEFKIANAVIHFDEASPHMHVVGIPVWEGAKRGLSKKVSKRNVFTPQTLSVILQDKLRAEASYGFECYFKEQLAEKKKGRNHDLSVTEYKVAQESRKLADIKQQNNEEQEKNTKLRSNNASISYQLPHRNNVIAEIWML